MGASNKRRYHSKDRHEYNNKLSKSSNGFNEIQLFIHLTVIIIVCIIYEIHKLNQWYKKRRKNNA